ncbi:TRAP transporter substrate-binding protein [Methylobacterium soli]|nr:TRAP transporter substrate-binding protein [Methylobacterium soli]
MLNPTRRSALLTGLAASTFTILPSISRAATVARLASNLPSNHPMVIRLKEAAEAIKKDTNGELEIRMFPSSQLGGDLEVLSQLRSGAIQFYPLAGAQLSTLVPVSSLSGVGFAFQNINDVWKATDGEVGGLIRGAVADANLVVFDKMFDNGFRQVTTGSKPIERPEDLKGLSIRVPPSPLSTSLFKAFGAAPQSISFGEVYTALQTKLVEAQENPLGLIDSNKFYEVQKFVSMTSHMWDGFWTLSNKTFWNRLPQATRDIVIKRFDEAVLAEREDVAKLNDSLIQKLKGAGMTFVEPNRQGFREALNNTSFYQEWKGRFGAKAWETLERYTGKLG